MAVTYIGASNVAWTSGANPTTTPSTLTQAGDLLIIFVTGPVYPAVPGTPSGWTALTAINRLAGNTISIFYRTAIASTPAVTLTNCPSNSKAITLTYRNAAIDLAAGGSGSQASANYQSSATFVTMYSLYPQYSPETMLMVAANSSAITQSFTAPAGVTVIGLSASNTPASTNGAYIAWQEVTGGYIGNSSTSLGGNPNPTVPSATSLSGWNFTLYDPNVTYTLTRSVSNVNEGSSFTITFATGQSGSFPYTISGVTSADINGASLTGTVTNGTVLTYTVTADLLLEGAETFSIALNNGFASTTVLINDTSNSISIISSANVQEFGSITIAYPLEISTLYAISDWSEKILFNDLEAVSYPVQTSVPVSSVLLPFSNDLEAVSYPVELSVEQKLIDNFSNKTQTYTPISITSPLELSVPVSSVLLPFSNDLEAVSYPLQTSIIHNLINPRINSIGFNNGSVYLDGTNGIDITEPAGNLYSIGTNFTAELWVRFEDLQAPVGLLAKRADTGINPAEWITLSVTAEGFIKLEVSSTSVLSGWALVLTGTQSLGKGIWYHIAVVKSGNTWNIYLNGKQYASGISSGTVISTFSTLSVGAYASNETYSLKGYIGGVRLVKDIALYTSEFIPPNYAFTNTQAANQDALPSLAIASGTVLLINPKYTSSSVSDDSGNSAIISNTYSINSFSPLELNLNTKFNNLYSTQSITAPFVANISGIGGVTTAAITITELWI